MAATGFFNLPLANTLLARQRVIYRAPSTPPTGGGSIPISRLPGTPPPAQPPIIRMPPPTPTPVRPILPAGGEPTAPTGTTPTTPPATTPGTTTGAGNGGSGGSTDSRLLDLLAGAFKPQDISQPYGPISSGPVSVPSSGGGVNPALLILAFVAIVGVMWWMNRKNKRQAA